MEKEKLTRIIQVIGTIGKFILWIIFFCFIFNLASGCELPLAFTIVVSGLACFLISIYVTKLKKEADAKITPLGIWSIRLSQYLFFAVPFFVFITAFGGWSKEQTIVTFSIAIAAIFFLILGIFFIKRY